jgi:hypothetical protein
MYYNSNWFIPFTFHVQPPIWHFYPVAKWVCMLTAYLLAIGSGLNHWLASVNLASCACSIYQETSTYHVTMSPRMSRWVHLNHNQKPIQATEDTQFHEQESTVVCCKPLSFMAVYKAAQARKIYRYKSFCRLPFCGRQASESDSLWKPDLSCVWGRRLRHLLTLGSA